MDPKASVLPTTPQRPMSPNKLPEIPVEQMFYSTGILLDQKRSSMAPCRANMVFFIYDYYIQFFPLSYHQTKKWTVWLLSYTQKIVT